MAEREWAGRWAAGSLPNDINNILYWAATAERGRGDKEWGVGKKKGNGEKKIFRVNRRVMAGG